MTGGGAEISVGAEVYPRQMTNFQASCRSRDCIALEGASTKCKKRAASSLSELQANSVDEDPLPVPNRCCGGIFPPFGWRISITRSVTAWLYQTSAAPYKPAI